MSEVFILGAGFSKAISLEMPLIKELSQQVFERYKGANAIASDVRRMMEEDFEKALTFLAQEKPWMPESENLRHRALYLDLTNVIRGILDEKCKNPLVFGINRPAFWLEALITYWHNNHCIVMTLNYDTLIERVAGSIYWAGRSTIIPTGDLYPIPLIRAAQRSTATFLGYSRVETFKLFKLHGSTNWFYSGRSNFYGEELYYVPCIGGLDGTFDAAEGRDPEKFDWAKTRDKTSLIIPPILDKAIFFQHESLRSMWFQASQEVKTANKIVCMGYSLPISDLTMAQFLKSSAPPQKIPFEIVDMQSKHDHFGSTIGAEVYDFSQECDGEDCIPTFVVKNCIPKEEDKASVIRMSQWNAPQHRKLTAQ